MKNLAFLILIISNGFMLGQDKDLDKSLKSNKKINGYYVAQLSKNITPEKFNEWERKNSQYKILSTKQSNCLIFGVTKRCVTEVNFLPLNEDALVVLPSGKLHKMSKNGAEITYDSYENEKQGLIKVKLGNNWGCLDKTGKEIIPILYSGIDIQNNGLVKVHRNDKAGYLNNTGVAVSPMYDEISWLSYTNVHAKVKLNGKYGFINDSGKEIISLQYEDVKGLGDGLIAVKQNGKWGYIDSFGKTVIPMEYDNAENFKDGIGMVSIKGTKGCIDKTGNIKLPIKYPELSGCSHDERAKVLIDEGTFTGKATYTYSFGTYTGDFVNGRPHGSGQLNYGSGSWYSGRFVNGEMHGKGEERVCDKGESLVCLRIAGNYTHNKRDGTFDAWKGTWLTGTNEWKVVFKNGQYVSATQTSSAASDFWDTSPTTSYSDSKSTSTTSCEINSENEYPKYRIKEGSWDETTFVGTKYKTITFEDNGTYSGRIFYHKEYKEYYIDTTGANHYYKKYEDALYALFVYKKCGEITKRGLSK